jgi:hypothetical protein
MLQLFFIVIGASIGIFFLMWLLVYAVQFIRPDRPKLPQDDIDLIRRVRMKAGRPTKVWFSDIRSLERDRVLVGEQDDEYTFMEGASNGWPEIWTEDIYRRRN